MKNRFLKIFLFGSCLLSFQAMGESETEKFKATLKCISEATEEMRSLEDINAAYGDDISEDLFEAQMSLAKEDIFRCIRKNNNRCAVKSLDSLIEKNRSSLDTTEILKAIQTCIESRPLILHPFIKNDTPTSYAPT